MFERNDWLLHPTQQEKQPPVNIQQPVNEQPPVNFISIERAKEIAQKMLDNTTDAQKKEIHEACSDRKSMAERLSIKSPRQPVLEEGAPEAMMDVLCHGLPAKPSSKSR